MGKIVEQTINQFDGGIADDIRFAPQNTFAISHHFDIYSKPHKLIPYRDMEDEAGAISVYKITDVMLFTDSAGTQAYFALGRVSGQTWPQILEKTTLTGTFATSTNGNSTAGTVLPGTLIGYKNQNKLYWMRDSGSSTTVVSSYDPAANTLVEAVGTISATSSTSVYPRPFRHPQDDVVYFGAGNVVASLNASTFTAAALTLPKDLNITSFADYGAYLAIACAPINQGEKSVLFLWGRDTSLTTVQESLDMGEGALMIIENISGTLIGISAHTQIAGTTLDIEPKIIFRAYTGGSPKVIKEIKWDGSGTPTTLLKNFKAKKNDNLYFACKHYIENKTVNQLWVCGRNAAGFFFVTPDRLINNDTALTGNVDGFNFIGDYLWAGYNGDGSLKRTDDAANFTASALYESVVFNAGDSSLKKDLIGVTVMTEPLPTAGQVIMKYRTDHNTSWTTILTTTTDNEISHSAVNVESSGAALPKDWKEIHFRLESTGNAIITGFSYKAEITDRRLY